MRVLLTGAHGFIGAAARLALLRSGCEVVVCRIGETPPELDRVDVCVNAAIVSRDSPTALIESNLVLVERLLNYVIRAGVRRFVHLSSISVYGEPPSSGLITEASPRLASLGVYSSMKQVTENAVISAAQQLEVVVLQPGIVYGPGSGYWTAGILEAMRQNVWPLIDHGSGYCNPIHVSDVGAAIAQAVIAPKVAGNCFLLCNPDHVSWGCFFRYYERLLGYPCLMKAPRSFFQEPQVWPPLVRRLIHKAVRIYYGRALADFSYEQVAFYQARPIFSSSKAEKMLGFRPALTLAQGMATLAG